MVGEHSDRRGKKDRGQAKAIAEAWQQAENEARNGELSHDRVAEILNETLKRIGASPVERITVGDYLRDWLAVRTSQVSQSTAATYKMALERFLEYLGPSGQKRRLEAITEKDIQGFIDKLKSEGRTPNTINQIVRSYLTLPFERAKRAGKIRFNPVMLTDRLKAEVATKQTFTPEQVAKLVLSAKGTDWEGAIILAHTTGARLQDIANMRWTNLDLECNVVSFSERKTGRKAVIGMGQDFIDWIGANPSRSDEPDAYVFPSLPNQTTPGKLSFQFKGLMKKAGIDRQVIKKRDGAKSRSVNGLSFHSFRHSAASTIFNQAALKEITSASFH
jgi:integrase